MDEQKTFEELLREKAHEARRAVQHEPNSTVATEWAIKDILAAHNSDVSRRVHERVIAALENLQYDDKYSGEYFRSAIDAAITAEQVKLEGMGA